MRWKIVKQPPSDQSVKPGQIVEGKDGLRLVQLGIAVPIDPEANALCKSKNIKPVVVQSNDPPIEENALQSQTPPVVAQLPSVTNQDATVATQEASVKAQAPNVETKSEKKKGK